MRTPTAARGLRFAAPCSLLLGSLLLALPALLSGCSLVGAAAGKAMAIKVKPSYTGLQNQTVGVYVSADAGLRNDFPTLQLDVARGLIQKLQGAQAAGAEELKGTQFP